MSNKYAITNLILFLIGIGGYFINGYWGGITTGFCLSVIFLVSIGRWQIKKAARLIDKKSNDIISNR